MLEHCQLAGRQLPTLGFPPFSSLGLVHLVLLAVTDPVLSLTVSLEGQSSPSAHWEMTGDLNGGRRLRSPPNWVRPQPGRSGPTLPAQDPVRFIEMIVYDDFHGGGQTCLYIKQQRERKT